MKEIYEKSQTCCFTGHREILPEHDFDAIFCLQLAIRNALSAGYRHFICGGAVGFDTIAAYTVLYFKRVYNVQINLLLCLPCQGQEQRFSSEQQKQYTELRALADDCEVLSPSYYSGCMHARNRRMIDLSSRCIFYWNGRPSGGTYYTVGYAQKQGVFLSDNIYDAAQLRGIRKKIGPKG